MSEDTTRTQLSKKEAQEVVEEKATQALRELQSSLMLPIPGLEIGKVIEDYVDKEFKKDFDNCQTEEEKIEMRKKIIKHYTNTEAGKKFIEDTFNGALSSYGQVRDSFENLPKAITSITTSTSIPSVITVGEATSSPNPAWNILDTTAKIVALIGVVKAICTTLGQLFGYLALLRIEPPSEILQLQAKLTDIMRLLNSVPI